MFLGDFIRRAAESWPDREAVVDVSRGARGRFTYRQLAYEPGVTDTMAALLERPAPSSASMLGASAP